MANLYVRSTDGLDADNGTTWALAKATIQGALLVASAGDIVWVSQVHAESSASSISMQGVGTIPDPVKIICANDGAAPPTALATTATVTCTASGGFIKINTTVGGQYWYGINFIAGSGTANLTDIRGGTPTGSMMLVMESCTFNLNNSNAGSYFYMPDNGTGGFGVYNRYINCGFKFGSTSSTLLMYGSGVFDGCYFISGTQTPSTCVFTRTGSGNLGIGGPLLIQNCDFSNLGSAVNLLRTNNEMARDRTILRNCKLPASWSGSLVGVVSIVPGFRAEMYNCDNGATNYKISIKDYVADLVQEATIVRTGGASDGVTPLSWKIITTANCGFLAGQFSTPEIMVYNATTGSAKTLTVEIVRDSLTNLKDNEIWLEVEYLGSSATPVGTVASDRAATAITTAADQTASAATWTTTGLTNPNKQKLAVTFTPQMAGFFQCKVVVAKLSTTVYVDPVVTVS